MNDRKTPQLVELTSKDVKRKLIYCWAGAAAGLAMILLFDFVVLGGIILVASGAGLFWTDIKAWWQTR